jgi:hypothetical protein
VAERKAVAKLLFKLIRQEAPQADIEVLAFAEGERQGLSKSEVIQIANWVLAQATGRAA